MNKLLIKSQNGSVTINAKRTAQLIKKERTFNFRFMFLVKHDKKDQHATFQNSQAWQI